jgi:ankyrin repeat protein
MHFSVDHGHLGIVKLLLERGADVHALGENGETSYQISLQRGYREIADLLREHGVGSSRFEGIFI